MQTPSAASSASPAVKQRGWFARNWLKLFLLFVLIVVAGAGGGYYYKFRPILTSEPRQQGKAELKKSPQVKKLLGEPVRDGWFPAGSVSKDDGEARMYPHVHGPKTADGKEPAAEVSIQARALEGKWDFTQFDVQPEG